MKKITLSILATLAIGSSSLYAEDSGLYLGVAYSNTNVDFSTSSDFYNDTSVFDVSTDSLLLLAGYDINEYVGVEGRYYWNITSMGVEYYASGVPIIQDYNAESFAFYVKPQYSFDMITVYALLGVAMNDYTALALSSINDDTLFSWGIGAKFNMTQSFGAFVDYTDLGETEDIMTTDLSSWNLGITYKF